MAVAAALWTMGTASLGQRGQGPPGPPGTSAISGVVVDSATGEPLSGAVVTLGPLGQQLQGRPGSQVTDAKGRFAFARLPAYDGYFLSVSKPGYLEGAYGPAGDRHINGRISLANGQWVSNVRLMMTRPGVIGGRVVDDRAEPIAGALIRVLMRVAVGAGEPQLVAGPFAIADDRGEYRLGRLVPGTYFAQVPAMLNEGPTPAPGVPLFPVAPRSPEGEPRVYPITFYPAGLAIAHAVAITVSAGESRTGVDVCVTPVVGRRVSGRVEGPAPVAGLTLRLMPAGTESLGDGGAAAATVVGKDGSFAFDHVPPGVYTVDGRDTVSEYQVSSRYARVTLPRVSTQESFGQGYSGLSASLLPVSLAWRSLGSSTGQWVRQPLEVGGRDMTGVIITAHTGGRVSGRFVFEGAARPTMDALAAMPAGGSAPPGLHGWRSAGSPGTFVIDGLMPGGYVLTSGFFIKSAVCAGRDYVDREIVLPPEGELADCVVTITSDQAGLSGVVFDNRAQPAPASAVMLFSVDPTQWVGLRPARVQRVAATSSGSFRFAAVPAGFYNVIAVPLDQSAAWFDPEYLRLVAGEATRVRLDWGIDAKQDLSLKAIRWPR